MDIFPGRTAIEFARFQLQDLLTLTITEFNIRAAVAYAFTPPILDPHSRHLCDAGVRVLWRVGNDEAACGLTDRDASISLDACPSPTRRAVPDRGGELGNQSHARKFAGTVSNSMRCSQRRNDAWGDSHFLLPLVFWSNNQTALQVGMG